MDVEFGSCEPDAPRIGASGSINSGEKVPDL
jgi:hypothetical protein